jgi:hypothetical protein
VEVSKSSFVPTAKNYAWAGAAMVMAVVRAAEFISTNELSELLISMAFLALMAMWFARPPFSASRPTFKPLVSKWLSVVGVLGIALFIAGIVLRIKS